LLIAGANGNRFNNGRHFLFHLAPHKLETRIQVASAAVGLIPKNTSLGVLNPRHFPGRLFNLPTTCSI